jgi:hypothetical protein
LQAAAIVPIYRVRYGQHLNAVLMRQYLHVRNSKETSEFCKITSFLYSPLTELDWGSSYRCPSMPSLSHAFFFMFVYTKESVLAPTRISDRQGSISVLIFNCFAILLSIDLASIAPSRSIATMRSQGLMRFNVLEQPAQKTQFFGTIICSPHSFHLAIGHVRDDSICAAPATKPDFAIGSHR